jgi:transcriptional regulator with XRE-family HTH domain
MEKILIGKKLAQTRKAAGFSQTELAEKCGWEDGQSRVSNYERGTRSPDIYDLERIAKACSTSVPEMLYPDTLPSNNKQTLNLSLSKNVIIAIENYLDSRAEKLAAPIKAELFNQLYSRLAEQPDVDVDSIVTILNVSSSLKTNL